MEKGALIQIARWLEQALGFYVLKNETREPDAGILLKAHQAWPLQGVESMSVVTDIDGDLAIRWKLKKPRLSDTTDRDLDPAAVAALQILGLVGCRVKIEPRGDNNAIFYLRGYFPNGDRFEVRRFVADASEKQKVREPDDYHSLQRKRLVLVEGDGKESFADSKAFALASLENLLGGNDGIQPAIADARQLANMIDLARMILNHLPVGVSESD